MSEWHLTKLETGEDFRIPKGRKFTVTVNADGDKSNYTFQAQIRQTADNSSTLAVFNSLTPTYNAQTDKTTCVLYLTPNQTSAIPLPTKTRNTIAETKPGVNVWVWDARMVNNSDPDDIIALVSYSWVELIVEVTR